MFGNLTVASTNLIIIDAERKISAQLLTNTVNVTFNANSTLLQLLSLSVN